MLQFRELASSAGSPSEESSDFEDDDEEDAIGEDEAAIFDACPYCPDILPFYYYGRGPLIVECYELFHRPCSTCSPPAEHTLCDSCRHMRLWHFDDCVDFSTFSDTSTKRRLPIRRSFSLAYLEDATCPLCRFINVLLRAADLDADHMAIDTVHLDICPEENERQTSRIADIYVWPKDDELAKQYGHRKIGLVNIGRISSDVQSVAPHCSKVTTRHSAEVSTSHSAQRPLIGAWVSWQRVREITQQCFGEHLQCQRQTSIRLPNAFRVIDVERRCVVELAKVPFVALSYVWGPNASSSVVTCKDTLARMSIEGSLSPQAIPQTIEDAIHVCEELNERFLWVDRLCIIQDDEKEKAHQINAMGDIYSAASFVIVAAYGGDMDFGLPGVSRPRTIIQQQSDRFCGIVLTQLAEDGKDGRLQPLAKWETRGWTYQEAALARKSLYFTNRRVYYECEQLLLHEDEYNNDHVVDKRWTHRLLVPDDRSLFAAYDRHLDNYSRRTLSTRTDVYAAFAGITNSLFGHDQSTFHGLPLAYFSRALQWLGKENMRYDSDDRDLRGRLPTWSWSSNMNSRWCSAHTETPPYYGALTTWYRFDAKDTTSLLVIDELADDELHSQWQVSMAIAAYEGCTSIRWTDVPVATNWSTVQMAARARWSNYAAFRQQAIQSVPEVTKDDIQTLSQPADIILANTQVALFCLEWRQGMWLELNIVDVNGLGIGRLVGEAPTCNKLVDFEGPLMFKFIALSLSGLGSDAAALENKRYHDSEGTYLDDVPTVNVMLISEHGSVAHREAIGYVFLVDWARADRKWETVVLE